MRRAFTLIEMMIAIVIFSLIVLFLYKSYDALRQSNKKYITVAKEMEKMWRIKKMLYLDFTLLIQSDVKVFNKKRSEDVVLLQTSNSLHNRFYPYVAYVVKEGTLYRLESLRKLSYPFDVQTTADVDEICRVKQFRIYKTHKKENGTTVTYYLIDIELVDDRRILYKVRALNES